MAGIYGLFLKGQNENEFYRNFYNFDFSNSQQDEVEVEHGYLGRSVVKRMEKDRFFHEDDRFIICFEGINYSEYRSPQAVVENFLKKGWEFASDFEGVFSGFLYSKEQRKLFVFTEPYATKKIYFYHNPDYGFAFSSEMHTLSKLLRSKNIPISVNSDGIYSLAIYGQMLREITTVKEITRLKYASVLIYDFNNGNIDQKSYYTYKKDVKSQSLSEVIENVNRLMTKAVVR